MRALVEMMVCLSLDGRLSTADDAPPNQEKRGGWTSEEDKEYLKEAVARANMIIMGRKTAEMAPNFKKDVAIISRQDNITTRQTGEIGIVRPERIEMFQLLDMLYKAEVGGGRALLFGGAQTYALFLQNDLVDSIRMTLEPAVLQTGPALGFNGLFNTEATVNKFTLMDITRMNRRGSLQLLYERAR